MCGFDEHDPTSLEYCAEQPNQGARIREQFEQLQTQFEQQGTTPLKGLRIGVIKEFLNDTHNADVASSLDEALRKLEQVGAERVEVALALIDQATPAHEENGR